jgi:two-component system CheB/CheR fusion protein
VSRSLVLFIEGEEFEVSAAPGGTATNREATARLRQELELAHVRLRTMREESDAANEELRSAVFESGREIK